MRAYFLLISLLLFSCQNKHSNKQQNAADDKAIKQPSQKSEHTQKPVLDEFFADSLNIGRSGFDKVEVAKYSLADSNYAIIKFYSKQKNGWSLRNEFHFAKDEYLACDPQLSDFNHDGLNDMTYVSDAAARGANDVRRLFIYDKNNDSLICIKNSEDYPNLRYNKKLDCLDAFLVSGCYVTAFLKIEKDSLREFAEVDICHGRLTVSTYNRQGKEKIIQKKRVDDEDMTHFKNYSPLEENNDND